MRKKPVFICIILAVLLCIGAFVPVAKYLSDHQIVEGLNAGITLPEPVPDEGIFSPVVNGVNEVTYKLESAYQNFLPFQVGTVSAIKGLTRSLNKPFFELYRRNMTPQGSQHEKIKDHHCTFLGTAGGDRMYQVDIETEAGETITFIDVIADLTEEQRAERVVSQAAKINRLIRAVDEGVNVSVFATATMEFQDFVDTFIPEEKSAKSDLDKLFSLLDPRAESSAIHFDDIFDRLDRVYLSDHHWTAHGIYKGYCDILELLKRKAPDIPDPRPYGDEILVEPCRFYGSYSRRLAMQELWDPFVTVDYHLPYFDCTFGFDTKAHADWPLDFEKRVQWLRDRNITHMNASVYGEFYMELPMISYPDNHTGHKLLVIGDSYMQGVAELLASNFDESYFFYWQSYRSLSLNDFIREHGITDVLISLWGPRLVYNAGDDYFLDRIKIDADKETP